MAIFIAKKQIPRAMVLRFGMAMVAGIFDGEGSQSAAYQEGEPLVPRAVVQNSSEFAYD
jgi:hypothetical protein